MKSRLCLSLCLGALLFVAGCEQQRPPTAEGLRLIASRTATGTHTTKLEARPQPHPVKTGISIWDLKVFDRKDKEDGSRKEWKFYAPLPQSTTDLGATEVLMRAWLVSSDGHIFLPRSPVYKAYGSFVTDWDVPRAGPYTLFVEYQPLVKDPNSIRRGEEVPPELARWDFDVQAREGAPKSAFPTPELVKSGDASVVFRAENGAKSPFSARVSVPPLQRDSAANLAWEVVRGGQNVEIERPQIAFLSPNRAVLNSEPTTNTQWTPSQSGVWNVYLSFQKDRQRYIAPLRVEVG